MSIVDAANGAIPAPAAQAESLLWIVSDQQGLILDASPAATRLLNSSMRGLRQRDLVLFFERDRECWYMALLRAAKGEHVTESGRLRPKDRRPLFVSAAIDLATQWGRPALLWSFERSPLEAGDAAPRR